MTDKEAIEQIKNLIDRESVCDEMTDSRKFHIEAMQLALRALQGCDECRRVERPYAEWEADDEPWGWDFIACAKCSNCGYTFVLGELDMNDMYNEFKFCPHCGAEMGRVSF